MNQLHFENLGLTEISQMELLDLEGGNWLVEAAKAYFGEKAVDYAANTLYNAWNTGIGIMSAQGAKSGIIAGM